MCGFAGRAGERCLIDSKALEASPLEVPGIAASTLGLLFVIVLPAALLAVGAWWSCCGAESEDLSMKAKQRTLGVLLFLILLAGGVFALLTLRNAREEQAVSAAADGTIPLAAVSGNDLTQIVLHYQGETNTLRYTADGWTLAEDPAYHLDTSACNTMLTALSSLNAKGELSPQAGEDYGFAEPALTIEVMAAGETDTYTFGASNTMTGDLYVRKNNSGVIYTVSGTKAACFELTRAELFGAFNGGADGLGDRSRLLYAGRWRDRDPESKLGARSRE